MTTIEEKKNAILVLQTKQTKLINKIKSISKRKEPKREGTYRKRAFQVASIVLDACQIEVQKRNILATPIPKYNNGGIKTGGFATIGEVSKEIIIRPR